MSHRKFLDAAGVTWEVWDVRPEANSVRSPDGRGQAAAPDVAAPRWESPRLEGLLANGWLCFQSTGMKRRLAPIPDGWQDLEIAGLEQLCGEAAAVQPVVRSAALA